MKIEEEIENADLAVFLGNDRDNAVFIASEGLLRVTILGEVVRQQPVIAFIEEVAVLVCDKYGSMAITYELPHRKRAEGQPWTGLTVARSGRRNEFLDFSFQHGRERYDATERCGSLFAKMLGIDD